MSHTCHPVGPARISRFLSYRWRRHPSSSLEFPRKGWVSVALPCCRVSMELPELGVALVSAATPLVPEPAHLPGQGEGKRTEQLALGEEKKLVTDQHCWTGMSKRRGPSRACPCGCFALLALRPAVCFSPFQSVVVCSSPQCLRLPRYLRVNMGPVPRLQKHALTHLFMHSRFRSDSPVTGQALPLAFGVNLLSSSLWSGGPDQIIIPMKQQFLENSFMSLWNRPP